ncbi:MAG: hypothetical protein PWQ59_1439 [Thermoanaerobacterium sp.]|jgi:hypothetical protein|nr:hypothetical protein [Thermoanaerobacterium sp.]
MYFLNTYLEYLQRVSRTYVFPEYKLGIHRVFFFENFSQSERKIIFITHTYQTYESYSLLIPFDSYEEYKKIMFNLKKLLSPATYKFLLSTSQLFFKNNDAGYNLTLLIANFDFVPGLSVFDRSAMPLNTSTKDIDDLVFLFNKLKGNSEYQINNSQKKSNKEGGLIFSLKGN